MKQQLKWIHDGVLIQDGVTSPTVWSDIGLTGISAESLVLLNIWSTSVFPPIIAARPGGSSLDWCDFALQGPQGSGQAHCTATPIHRMLLMLTSGNKIDWIAHIATSPVYVEQVGHCPHTVADSTISGTPPASYALASVLDWSGTITGDCIGLIRIRRTGGAGTGFLFIEPFDETLEVLSETTEKAGNPIAFGWSIDRYKLVVIRLAGGKAKWWQNGSGDFEATLVGYIPCTLVSQLVYSGAGTGAWVPCDGHAVATAANNLFVCRVERTALGNIHSFAVRPGGDGYEYYDDAWLYGAGVGKGNVQVPSAANYIGYGITEARNVGGVDGQIEYNASSEFTANVIIEAVV